jgi:hypothetical protein
MQADAALSVRARWQVRARLGTGTYLPHPQISTRRVAQWSITLEPALDVWLDGVRVARRARELSVECLPDAFTIVV